MINYRLTRSGRRTIAIHVRDGQVEVRAPLRTPKQDIDAFVLSKEAWILKNQTRQLARPRPRDDFFVDYGSLITWRGKTYPIVSHSGNKAGFDGERFYMPPGLTTVQIKETCIQIYQRLALTYFTSRVEYYASKMGVSPSAVKVSNAKTRWGSCSLKKSLNFSWRLGLADDDVVDYVVVHELAHLIQMNHSKKFWQVVEGVLPDYASRKARLKTLHERLVIESW